MPQRQQACSHILTAASVPRFSRALSCSQHVYAELHNAAALSLDAHRLREALTSVARDAWLNRNWPLEGAKCHSRSRLAARAHCCFPRFSRVLSCSQHVYSELHSAVAQS